MESYTFYRFVEMMAPVFSIASWRCAWHMIQVYNLLLGHFDRKLLLLSSAKYVSEFSFFTFSNSLSERLGSCMGSGLSAGLLWTGNFPKLQSYHLFSLVP